MPRPKTFLKSDKNKKKTGTKAPSTVDEYQAAGVELEEAGEKWRAGDAAKALRFFVRAIDIYEQGLQKYPQSLDLAYNKARAQFETVTHPSLSEQLGQDSDRIGVLEDTLRSHRFALTLDEENTDTLFNTAQVLTSLAEEVLTRDESHGSDQFALQTLEEALELFQKCLSIQELRYEEFEAEKAEALKGAEDMDVDSMPPDANESLEEANEESSEGEAPTQWASVVEAITLDTLLDTVLAQLSSLTTLCVVLGARQGVTGKPSMAWLEGYSRDIVSDRLPRLIKGTGRDVEVQVAKAKLASVLLESGFKLGQIDAQTYERELDANFADLETQHATAPEVILEHVEALFSFNQALSESALSLGGRTENKSEISEKASLRWSALDTAITVLKRASTIPIDPTMPEFRPRTHYLRGDACLFQVQLSRPPWSYPPATQNEAAVLKNATVFYRNVSRLGSADEREMEKGKLREAVSTLLLARVAKAEVSGEALLENVKKRKGEAWVQRQVEEMISEGLLGEGDL